MLMTHSVVTQKLMCGKHFKKKIYIECLGCPSPSSFLATYLPFFLPSYSINIYGMSTMVGTGDAIVKR